MHPRRTFALLALLASAAGCEDGYPPLAPKSWVQPQVSGDPGKIAFVSNRDGNSEIYVMNADGSGVTRLTDNAADDSHPAWSPDGSRIAFTSTRDGNAEIYVMNADGTGVLRLTNDPSWDRYPAWCGTRIAFESDRYLSPFPDVYVMNDDGTGVTRLTQDNASFDQFPAWSPDCQRIAFTKDPSGSPEIYVMNADGTGVTLLASSTPGNDRAPAWSRDGTRIVFESSRDAPRGNTDFYDIYVMNADGTAVTRLTNNDSTAAHVVQDLAPAWSPDGTQIAFATFRDGNFEIYVMNADGTVPTRLTNNSAGDGSPAWSTASTVPTGDLIVTTSTAGPSPDQDGYIVTVDGGAAQPIGVNDTITFTGLAAGDHIVELSGLAENCGISENGPNPQTVTVPPGGSVPASFSITCSPTTGTLTVTMSTTGRFPDPDGYTVAIDGGAAQPVGSNDQLTFTGLAAGDHVVQLSGISRKCAVSGSNPVTITVPAGGTATAAFFLGCPFPKGERS